MSPPDGIKLVAIYGDVTEATEAEPPDVHPVSVVYIEMRHDVNLSVVEEMTHRMKIETLHLVVSGNHIYN